MCRIASLFLLQRLKGSMSGDARVFKSFKTQAVIKCFFKARHRRKFTPFYRNIKGLCTIVCHRQKLGGPV